MLSIYYIYTSSRFNFYSIRLVTLKLYNYNSLEKLIIRKVEKHFIRRLNIVVLDTISTPIRIYSAYALFYFFYFIFYPLYYTMYNTTHIASRL